MRAFKCEVCQKTFPEPLLHLHHKIPQSLGGPDTNENLASLDHTCHNNLHLLAYMIVNPKRRQEIEPTLHAIHPNDRETQKRLMSLAQLVAKEMALKKEIRKSPDAKVRVVVELPARYVELLKLFAYDHPTRKGKPPGVGRVVRMMVCEKLSQKYPQFRETLTRLLSSSE